MSKIKLKKHLTMFFTALIVAVTLITNMSISSANAGLDLCNTLGYQLHREAPSFYDKPNAKNGKYTMEELFGGATNWSMYYGEGEGTFMYADKSSLGEKSSVMYNDNVKEVLESSGLRTFGRCALPGLKTGLPSFMFGLTKIISDITDVSVGVLFNSVISDSIVDAIGGKGMGDSGIIGALTQGLYMPLVMFAVLFLAGWFIYQGIFKREFRKSLMGVLWAVMITVIGVAFMYSPKMVANFPREATNIVSNCVIGALSGENCLTGNSDNAVSEVIGTECSVAPGSDMERKVSGMSCSIWKTFVLDTWAQGQFGLPYNELYVKPTNMPSNGKLWQGAEYLSESEKNLFCVSLQGYGTQADTAGRVIETGAGSEVCNLAAYHLYLRSSVEDTSKTPPAGLYTRKNGNIVYNLSETSQKVNAGGMSLYLSEDARFYNLISAMADHDVDMFNIWANKSTHSGRMGNATVSFFGMLLAGGLLTLLAIFGASYQVIATITILFAPVFFLFAIHPGRGKQIFLGWLETLLSALMKHFASVLFAIIALLLYSAVLSNTSGMMSFISVLVLSSALYAYRKEVIELLGVVNMGGKRMSNELGKRMEKIGKSAKDTTSAVVGGAAGAALAGGDIKEGMVDSFARNLKRGTNTTAQAAKQFSRTKQALNKDADKNKNDTLVSDTEDVENVVENENVESNNTQGTPGTPNIPNVNTENVSAVDEVKAATTADEVYNALRRFNNDDIDPNDKEMKLALDVATKLDDKGLSVDDMVNSITLKENPTLDEVDTTLKLVRHKALNGEDIAPETRSKYNQLIDVASDKLSAEDKTEFRKQHELDFDKLDEENQARRAKERNKGGNKGGNDGGNESGPSSTPEVNKNRPKANEQPEQTRNRDNSGAPKANSEQARQAKPKVANTNEEVRMPKLDTKPSKAGPSRARPNLKEVGTPSDPSVAEGEFINIDDKE